MGEKARAPTSPASSSMPRCAKRRDATVSTAFDASLAELAAQPTRYDIVVAFDVIEHWDAAELIENFRHDSRPARGRRPFRQPFSERTKSVRPRVPARRLQPQEHAVDVQDRISCVDDGLRHRAHRQRLPRADARRRARLAAPMVARTSSAPDRAIDRAALRHPQASARSQSRRRAEEARRSPATGSRHETRITQGRRPRRHADRRQPRSFARGPGDRHRARRCRRALDDWSNAAPRLNALSEALERGSRAKARSRSMSARSQRRCRARTSSSTAARIFRTSCACAARAAPRCRRVSTPIR